ncbi:MAG: diguanylate cyclase [Clostridiales bacterium]|nr:diguanylate cyclase [Clostridiales bacterium]
MKLIRQVACLFVVLSIFTGISHGQIIEPDFYSMFDGHGSSMMLIDTETGEIRYANAAAAKFYGYSIEILTNMNISEINTLSVDEINDEISAASKEQRNFFVFEHRLGNGDIRNVEVYSYPYVYGDQKLLFSIIHDITEEIRLETINKRMNALLLLISTLFIAIVILKNNKLKKTKDELFNYSELRRNFIDADDRLVYLKDENLNYVFINKAMESFYKMQSSEIVGKDDYALTTKEFAELRRATDYKVLETMSNDISQVEWDGRIYRTNKFPIELLNGKVGVGAYIEDITEHIHSKRKESFAKALIQDSKDQLHLILDSTVEAIYGMDIQGKCTFINKSGLKLLGYEHQEEILGKDIHSLIHHTYHDGRTMPFEECKIYLALKDKRGTHVDDEVFWRKDGSSFNVEYYSHPQHKASEIVGAVVTFMDNTERKHNSEKINYLSYHDSLTGLYNRRYFEDVMKEMDVDKNYPITIIFGDVNGLKLTNDIYGHAAGDALLIKMSDALKKICRDEDVIARVGGDEFAILLHNTGEYEAGRIVDRIKEELSKEKVNAIQCSISLGYDVKHNAGQSIERSMEAAEKAMYRDKTSNKKNVNSNMIHTIIETLHDKSPREKAHYDTVSLICERIGVELGLQETEVKKLKEAGLLHDIGKIIFVDTLLDEDHTPSDEEKHELEKHPAISYRILNLFEETMELAEIVFNHHEYMDGTGYPKGISGEKIPYLSRILTVAEDFDAMTNSFDESPISKNEAIAKIKLDSGKKYDRSVVDAFLQCYESEHS